MADERVFREQFAIDLRHPAELAVERAPGVVNIPLPQLRQRLAELPRDREIHVICRSGQQRLLRYPHPFAERVQGAHRRQRDAVAYEPRRQSELNGGKN
ncbi:MAG: rhodanese-like domain-containing protein [Anaerolineae bacterium]